MPEELFEQGFVIEESKIHLKTDMKEAISEATEAIKYHRKNLVNYIKNHPEFQHTLKPIMVSPKAPEVVKSMANSANKADVGPMAAVAGALADLGMKAMLRTGAKTAIVEDGGEIAVTTVHPVIVTILSSYPEITGKIGFRITEEDSPIGIATSSSKTGRVISFGEADSVTVIATDASLADAAATAICNTVRGEDVEASIQKGLGKSKTIEGVRGVIIIREGKTGLWGKLPKIISIK
jgi:ApbE superfamily uncharacterized protein (UPF0280 family)